MLTQFIFYILIVFPGTAGEMCMARAMKTVGEVTDFHPKAIARAIGRAMRIPWFWIGLTMMTTGFFALLGMLSVANVSFVFPATAISYLFVLVASRLFLGERVTPQRLVGVALVCMGVALVALGKQ
ncbi:MAG: EamA family transporter [Candidatus Acidiferrales bacterium]